MRIENIIFTNMILNDKEFFLNENSILKGKVISSFGDTATIKFPKLGIIEAEIDSSMKLEEGDEIKFLVKTANDQSVSLKPIVEENIKKAIIDLENKNSIIKLLKENNIEENSKTVSLVEGMMKQNLSINKENILIGLKILEKFVELTKLDDNQEITLIDMPSLREDSSNDNDTKSQLKPEDVEIKYFIIEESNKSDEYKLNEIQEKDIKLDNEEKINEKNIDSEKNIIKENLIEKDQISSNKELKEIVKDFLGSYTAEKENNFIKTIGLFIKSGIKPSLKNIKYMTNLNEDPLDFIKELKDFITKEDKVMNKILLQKSHGDLEEKEIKLISTDNKNLGEITKTIEDLLKTTDSKSGEELNSITNKLNFLKELDKNMNFLFYPLNFGEKKELEGLLSFIKDKRSKSNKKKDLNIFISLNTHNLGNIKVFCKLINSSLQVKIHIREEDLEIFKNSEDKLIEKINSIGYSVNGIDFIVNKEFVLLDHMDDSLGSTYLLDLKA